MNLYCWWFGCAPHEQDPAPIDEIICFRCNQLMQYGDLVGDTRHNRALDKIKAIKDFVFPKKCATCGHRRKCDESVDHIPF